MDVVQAHLILEGEAAHRRIRLPSRVVPTGRHQFVALIFKDVVKDGLINQNKLFVNKANI